MRVVWRHPIDMMAIDLRPAGDQVFVHAHRSHVVCLDAQRGTVEWRVPAERYVTGITVGRDHAFSHHGWPEGLTAFDRWWTGQVRWKDPHALGAPIAHGGLLFLERGGPRPGFGVLDEARRRWRWFVPTQDLPDGLFVLHRPTRMLFRLRNVDGGLVESYGFDEGVQGPTVAVPLPSVRTLGRGERWRHVGRDPIVFAVDPGRFLVLGGTPPVQVVPAPVPNHLTCVHIQDGRVIFVTAGTRVVTWDVHTDTLRRYGTIDHLWRHHLPATTLPHDRLAVGTSLGRLHIFDADGTTLAAKRVGKRITTQIHPMGDLLVMGTQSGEVLAIHPTEDP